MQAKATKGCSGGAPPAASSGPQKLIGSPVSLMLFNKTWQPDL
jgi:hypothetical protein